MATAMLQASTLSSMDFPAYEWPEAELARFNTYMGSTAPLWTPPQSTPGIGHNNPPRVEETKFAQQIEAIIDSDYTSPQKLILLKIRLRSDHRTLRGAFPSYATLRRAASVKDNRTVSDALRELVDEDETGRQRGILTRETREGSKLLLRLLPRAPASARHGLDRVQQSGGSGYLNRISASLSGLPPGLGTALVSLS